MKKIILVIWGILILAGLVWAANFYWQNLRGTGPALKKSSKDIVKIIEEADRAASSTNKTGLPLKLPPGFAISIFAQGLPGARVMTIDPDGRFLVSLTGSGKVVALPDEDVDGRADKIITVLEGLDRPHGLAFKCEGNAAARRCKLYVAESDQVATYDYREDTARATNKKKIINLPNGGNHYTRTIMFMPLPNEDKLLLSVGSSCNVCRETDKRRAKILAADADGTGLKVFAAGLRNSVFMAVHPKNGKIWATEMGRDFLGDDLPPDEINIIEEGRNYGFPVCYGKNIHDADFDKNAYVRTPCQLPAETPSYIDIPAHSAPLGLAFIPAAGWPPEYQHNLLVAYHGSWNRSAPTGYKIVRYKLDEAGNYLTDASGALLFDDFISGWLTPDGKEALGRPVDLLALPGGLLYVSDDKAGVIYRVAYQGGFKPLSDKSNLIVLSSPRPNQSVRSPLIIEGQARGSWFFEGVFPVKLFDQEGGFLSSGQAKAVGEWTTENFVPFWASLEFEPPASKGGILVLEKDNPSGLLAKADEIRLPLLFTSPKPASACVSGGCSGQICSDRASDGLISTCEYKAEYACYKNASCERQADGRCGWTETGELLNCLQQAK